MPCPGVTWASLLISCKVGSCTENLHGCLAGRLFHVAACSKLRPQSTMSACDGSFSSTPAVCWLRSRMDESPRRHRPCFCPHLHRLLLFRDQKLLFLAWTHHLSRR